MVVDTLERPYRVLVLGGTNFIGRGVVRQLRDHRCAVAVFHRGEHEADDEPEGVRHVHGDRAQLETFRDEFTAFAPDVVVDMRAMVEADAKTTARVMTGIARRAVLISSMDVYRAYDVLRGKDSGSSQPVPFDERSELRKGLYPYRSDPPRADSDPAKWMDGYDKILIERIFLDNDDMPGTVLRLPAVYGPRDRQTRFLAVSKRINDGRHTIVLDETTSGWRFMHGFVDDMAHGIVLATLDDRASGQVYNIGEPQSPTIAERIALVAEAAGWDLRVVLKPSDAGVNEGYNFTQDMVGETTKIRRELGYGEQTPTAQGIRETVSWKRANEPAEVDASSFDYQAEDRLLQEIT